MLCKKCGNELKMGAKFCYNCGYYVDEEDYDEDDDDGSNKKKKKKKKNDDGEPKLSFKEKLAKKREEKQLAKEAKIRQKEIEAEEKEREKMAAEYEKEQKIKEFYRKEQANKIRAENKAKALEEEEKAKRLAKQKEIDDNFESKKSQFDDGRRKNVSESISSFDEEIKKNVSDPISKYDDDDENANFSYGNESLINRSPDLGVESVEDNDVSFDDFNVENRYKKIAGDATTSPKKTPNLDISYDEYKKTPSKKSKSVKSELSKYSTVIIASVVAFVVIFSLVYGITNLLNKENDPAPDPNVVVEDITVLLGNCTLKIPGDLNYNVELNSLYVAYDGFTLSFTVSKDNYESYSSDLTKLSRDFERRNYTVSSSDKREVNGKEFLVYKLIVDGSTKYFYLTKVDPSNIAMGMIELTGSSAVDEACQSINNIVSSVHMSN